MFENLKNKDQNVGKIIDNKYKLLEKIGEGGCAKVYRAIHIHLKQKVAVKILLEKFFNETDILNRFEREAKILARIKHNNIVEVFNFGMPKENSPAYIAMELLEKSKEKPIVAGTLNDILEANGKFSLEKAILLMLQICEGVEVAHNENIIHRDIKPGNIFISKLGFKETNNKKLSSVVKILDFGLAKPLFNSESWQPLTKSSKWVGGTCNYMSPEQFVGKEELDQRTDVYSLGLVFYEILSGRQAFNFDGIADLCENITSKTPPSLLNDGIPPDLNRIIEQAYSKNKEERFANATELRIALEDWYKRENNPTQKRAMDFKVDENNIAPTIKLSHSKLEKKDYINSKLIKKQSSVKIKKQEIKHLGKRLSYKHIFTAIGLLILFGVISLIIWHYFPTTSVVKKPSSLPPLTSLSAASKTKEILKTNPVDSITWENAHPEVKCHFINSENCNAVYKEKKIKPYSHFNSCSDMDSFSTINYAQDEMKMYMIENVDISQASNLKIPSDSQTTQYMNYKGTILLMAKFTKFDVIDWGKSIEKEGLGANMFSVWDKKTMNESEYELICDLCNERFKSIPCNEVKMVKEAFDEEK
jgi:eukaryotic-like serine/threonine-protein kinase